MMNSSFIDHSKNKSLFRYILTLLLCVGLFLWFSQAIGKQNLNELTHNLEETVRRDIVQCYALEGKYPESVQYLEDHYGLTYDKKSFYIDYLPIGENIIPDFTVIPIRR